MDITLKKAVDLLCGDYKNTQTFKFYLRRALRDTGTSKEVLKEGEVIEVQYGYVTISFTWDMISAVNNITNKYVDLTCPEFAFEVFD